MTFQNLIKIWFLLFIDKCYYFPQFMHLIQTARLSYEIFAETFNFSLIH